MKTAVAKIVSTALLASGLSLGGALAAATGAHADPIDCSIGAYGSNGNSSFTVHWNTNYCRYPVRAWAECTGEDFTLGWTWKTTSGSSTSISDSEEAQCGAGITESYYYGYDIYINGKWHRYNMYFDEWDY